MDISEGTERVNEEGGVEIKVDAVDHRSPPGQPCRKENVQVTRVAGTDENPGSGGMAAGAAAKVAETIQSAMENILGKTEGTNNEKNK